MSNTTNKIQAQEQLQQPKTAATREVAAEGGNAIAPWTIFVPQVV